MDKKEIYETVIREMAERALLERRENCAEQEQLLYAEVGALAKQRQELLQTLSPEQRQVLEDHFIKTQLVADHECQHLYVQGAKDCVELLKKLGAL